MSLTKKILFAIGIVFIAIQFIPPAHNKSGQISVTDISRIVVISDSVQAVLKNACYDCHSNNTNYPWYSRVQPIGWILENHINKGKAELNFSEFGSYSVRKQKSKLKSMANQIEKDEMPLASYTFIHHDARLSQESKKTLLDYLNALQDSKYRK
ncbi:MAG: heme-binding domain-containing protein [Bacteroidetes bacterium]|nr:heme-binding domain-containing protein [Bacteroidota bacterium]